MMKSRLVKLKLKRHSAKRDITFSFSERCCMKKEKAQTQQAQVDKPKQQSKFWFKVLNDSPKKPDKEKSQQSPAYCTRFD